MSDQVFIASVLIAVAAPDSDKAAETIAENLRERMIRGDILDWSYVLKNNQFAHPILTDLTVDEGGDEEINKQAAYDKAQPGYAAEIARLSPWQDTFALTYGGGDYSHVKSLAEVRAQDGDTVFTAVMVELDRKESCDDADTAVERLDSIIAELTAARDAIAAA